MYPAERPCVLAGIFAKAYTLFSTIPGLESYSADLLNRGNYRGRGFWLIPIPMTPVLPA